VARVGIGYVTGANDFFHLRPSRVASLDIPDDVLRISVRSNRDLAVDDVTSEVVASWLAEDRPVLLLDLVDVKDLPKTCGFTLVRCLGGRARCRVYEDYPSSESMLDYNRMFHRLYTIYDRRFVYNAPALKTYTRRKNWDSESPLLIDTILDHDSFAEMDVPVA
jgi:hypothetical protein